MALLWLVDEPFHVGAGTPVVLDLELGSEWIVGRVSEGKRDELVAGTKYVAYKKRARGSEEGTPRKRQKIREQQAHQQQVHGDERQQEKPESRVMPSVKEGRDKPKKPTEREQPANLQSDVHANVESVEQKQMAVEEREQPEKPEQPAKLQSGVHADVESQSDVHADAYPAVVEQKQMAVDEEQSVMVEQTEAKQTLLEQLVVQMNNITNRMHFLEHENAKVSRRLDLYERLGTNRYLACVDILDCASTEITYYIRQEISRRVLRDGSGKPPRIPSRNDTTSGRSGSGGETDREEESESELATLSFSSKDLQSLFGRDKPFGKKSVEEITYGQCLWKLYARSGHATLQGFWRAEGLTESESFLNVAGVWYVKPTHHKMYPPSDDLLEIVTVAEQRFGEQLSLSSADVRRFFGAFQMIMKPHRNLNVHMFGIYPPTFQTAKKDRQASLRVQPFQRALEFPSMQVQTQVKTQVEVIEDLVQNLQTLHPLVQGNTEKFVAWCCHVKRLLQIATERNKEDAEVKAEGVKAEEAPEAEGAPEANGGGVKAEAPEADGGGVKAEAGGVKAEEAPEELRMEIEEEHGTSAKAPGRRNKPRGGKRHRKRLVSTVDALD